MNPEFGTKFVSSVTDFYAFGTQQLFNEWWASASDTAISGYLRAIEGNPEQAALAEEAWYADPVSLEELSACPAGSLGAAYHEFMVVNGLEMKLAEGYRELHDRYAKEGKLNAMPPIMQYKVLRGYQTHDLHHVLTGYPATPFGELSLQGFELAQQNYPYSAMIVATVLSHAALVDPAMTNPAMDAISEGWAYGKRARSIQFVAFEKMLDHPLEDVRAEYDLLPLPPGPGSRSYDAVPALTGTTD